MSSDYDGMDEEDLKCELQNTWRLLKNICKRHNIDLKEEVLIEMKEAHETLEMLYTARENMEMSIRGRRL